MLVLTRKVGERILVGEDIVITVLDSRGDGVRIGIDAPRGVKIQREEVVAAVTAANVEATRSAADAEERLRAALGVLGGGARSDEGGAATGGTVPRDGDGAEDRGDAAR